MLSQTRKEQCNCQSELSLSLDTKEGTRTTKEERQCGPCPWTLQANLILSIPPKKLAILVTTGTGLFHDNWGAEKQVRETRGPHTDILRISPN